MYSIIILFEGANIQFCAHINASSLLTCSLLRCGHIYLPLVLKVDCEATLDTEIKKIPLAINCSAEY